MRGLGLAGASARRAARADRDAVRQIVEAEEVREETEKLIRHAIVNRSFETHFQPIVDLRSGQAIGAEALSRFGHLPVRAPDRWFAEAASVGLGVELELSALEAAIERLHLIPANLYLSLNASVETVMSEQFLDALDGVPAERIVIELTEHTPVGDYQLLGRSIEDVRSKGVRLAVDDAGSGFASLQHILNLQPDVIKLDIGLTRGIDKDPARRALGRALLTFGLDAYNASVIAEGIETRGEFETLRSLGCPCGQGFYLGRPGRVIGRHATTPAAALALVHSTEGEVVSPLLGPERSSEFEVQASEITERLAAPLDEPRTA